MVTMYIWFSTGFLIASLLQAAIILLTESLNISSLGVRLTLPRLIAHILVGQAAGYILWYMMKEMQPVEAINSRAAGIAYGAVLWAVVLTIAAILGIVEPPWARGAGTILSSAVAFMFYGMIAAYTIKRYQEFRV